MKLKAGQISVMAILGLTIPTFITIAGAYFATERHVDDKVQMLQVQDATTIAQVNELRNNVIDLKKTQDEIRTDVKSILKEIKN